MHKVHKSCVSKISFWEDLLAFAVGGKSFKFLEKYLSLVTLQTLEATGQVVPFWKLPISHCLEPVGHGGCMTFRAQNSHSKIAVS